MQYIKRACTQTAPVFFAMLLMVFLTSVMALQETELDDMEIVRAIENDLLFDKGVSNHLIDVSCKEGVVTLEGTVDNVLAKERAVAIAQSIRGVRSVINKVVVEPVARTDEQIKKNVTNALVLDPVTESFDITVNVDQGVVTLTGTVHSWTERRFAAQVAKEVKGIVDVVNELNVVHKMERTDEEIRTEIRKKIDRSIWINDVSLDILVENGYVTVSGVVGSAREKERVRFACHVSGVEEVDVSDVEVEWWAEDTTRKDKRVPLMEDEEIRNSLYDALVYDPRVLPTKIDIKVDKGLVSLMGSVTDYRARKAAEEDARNTIGVARVFNYLKVRPDLVVEDEEIYDYVDTAVKLDPYLERYQFKFTVANGKVYVNGAVDTDFDKYRVDQVVGRQPGVIDIANNVVVREAWEPKSDWAIKEDILNQYFWSMNVDGDDINVTVNDGDVVLEGTVDTKYEMQAAIKNAYEGGAHEVTNNISVQEMPEASDFLNLYDRYEMGAYRW